MITSGIAAGAGGNGVYTWQIPGAENPDFEGLNSNVVIQIRDLNDDSILDTSDSTFEIIQDFKLRVPNGGEYWYIGDTNIIHWESSFNLPVKVSLYMAPDGVNYYANAGGYLIDFQADSSNSSGSNTYDWVTRNDVPLLLTTNGRIRVQEPTVGVARYADESDEVFTMAGVVITSPAEGQKVKRNDPDGFDIEWTAIGAGSNVVIDISLDGGATFLATNLFASVTNTSGENVHNWVVTHPESDFAVLRIRSLSDGKVVGNSKVFTIAGIDVTAPDGGEEWLMGTTNTIEWVAGGAGDFVSIYYTSLYAGTGTNTEWTLIQASAPNALSYDWIVTDQVSPDARIKIVSDEAPDLFSVSQYDFSIAGVRVTFPNLLSDLVTMGEEELMTHDGAPLRWQSVQLDISYDEQTTWQTLGLGSDRWPMGGAFPFTTTYPSRKTKVRVTAVDATLENGTPLANIFDVSDDYFTSAGLLLNGSFDGSTNTLGSTYYVEWVTAGADETVDISYSSPETSGQQSIIQGAYNNNNYPGYNSYPWTVPTTAVPTEDAVLQIVSGSFTNSSAPFILRGIRIVQPIAGDMWDVGSQHMLSWMRAGMNQDALGSILLSLDGGSTYVQDIVTNTALISVPFQSWTIDMDRTPTTNAIIRLNIESSGTAADVGMQFFSDPFTLRGIKILEPLAGDTVFLGVSNRIEFVAAGVGNTATILYSPDGGAHFDAEPIVADLPITAGANVYEWGVESDRTPSTNAVIKIVGNNVISGSSAESRTSGTFSLGGIRVDRPIAYDIWAVGEVNLISYISVGTIGLADLHLVYEDGHEEPVNNGNPLAGPTDGSETTLSTWTLPESAVRGLTAVSNVVLRVRDRDTLRITGYSAPFKIVRQARIEIVAPLEGDFLKVGEEAQITWVKGGYMEATDFKVFYTRDNFGTMDEIISRDPTYNSSNNTFVKIWPIPDKLGPVQILVTNTVAARSSVFDYSGTFDIVGDLNLSYPNGSASDEQIYAKSTIQVRWSTIGSVTNVNLFYQHDTSGWVQINDTPIPDNGDEYVDSTHLLEVPNVVTDTMRFRVQDANYSQTFDGTKPGPYDDSDNPFSVGYYTVLWEVGYFDEDTGEFHYMDNLSVTDSSGWSESGLTSLNADGTGVLIEHQYPYGVYDTVWYRQFFNDTVDFQWLCDSNQTRRVTMQESDTEPDAYVLADFTYTPSENALTIYSWIQRGGRMLYNPDSTTVTIYDTNGDVVRELTSSSVLADGFFRIIWNDVAVGENETPAAGQLVEGNTYLARVEVVFNGVAFSAAVTYTLSLAPEYDQITQLSNQIDDLETTVTNQVGELTDITESFRDQAIGKLDSISTNVDAVQVGITNLVKQVTSFSNSVITSQAMISNQLVDVISPALTNISVSVSNVVDSTSSDQARILNRPTTVEYGSTNTILYKTTRNLDIGQVTVSVEGENNSTENMIEMSDGIGIYSCDIIADWGVGSYTISCKGPLNPLVSDSIVLEVFSGGNSVAGFANTLIGIESQVSGISEAVDQLGSDGIGAVLEQISAALASFDTSGSSGSSSGGASASADTLDSLVSGSGGDASLIGQLSGISSLLSEISGISSSASKYALSAKNEAGSAVSAIKELKELLGSGGSSDEVNSTLDSIRRSIEAANTSISDIPKAMGATALHSQIGEVARQISELASREGYEYKVGQQALGAAGEGDSANEEMITVLNDNMSEVKISLEFMKKILDEKINEPVIQVDYIGVE